MGTRRRAHPYQTIRLKQLRIDLTNSKHPPADLKRRFNESLPTDHPRPQYRSECISGPRPCPYAGCRYHLYLDVNEFGSIKLNFPCREVWEIPETCALDVAERGCHTLRETGQLLNVSRERVRQVEKQAFTAFPPDMFANAPFSVPRDEGASDGQEDCHP